MTRTDDRLGNASAVAGYVGDLPQSRYCTGLCAPTMAIQPRGNMRGFLFFLLHKMPKAPFSSIIIFGCFSSGIV